MHLLLCEVVNGWYRSILMFLQCFGVMKFYNVIKGFLF